MFDEDIKDNGGKRDDYRVETLVPEPERLSRVAIRIYEPDLELLREFYPGSLGQPLRRLVRKLCDQKRRERGLQVRGQPGEGDFNPHGR